MRSSAASDTTGAPPRGRWRTEGRREPVDQSRSTSGSRPPDYDPARCVSSCHEAARKEDMSLRLDSLFPSSPACNGKESADLTSQAVLPPSWETLPNGKALRRFLQRRRSASVRRTGTFEADLQRYGPDGARFRFTISGISSVVPNIAPTPGWGGTLLGLSGPRVGRASPPRVSIVPSNWISAARPGLQ